MSFRRLRFGCLLLLVLGWSVPSYATICYVSTSGTSIAPYTSWETAAWFIEMANDLASPGDTVLIASGQYHLSKQIDLKPHVLIRGQGMDSTTVIGSINVYALFRLADSCSLEGVHCIANESMHGVFATSHYTDSYFITGCKFSNFEDDGIEILRPQTAQINSCWFEAFVFSGLSISESRNLLFENNTVYDPNGWAYGCSFIGCTGAFIVRKNIFVGTSPGFDGTSFYANVEVSNNLFYKNEWATGGFTVGAARLKVLNNSFYFSGQAHGFPYEAVWMWMPYLESCEIYNNIFGGYRPRIRVGEPGPDSSHLRIEYNCFSSLKPFHNEDFIAVDWDTIQIDSLWLNVYRDPMYVDPENGDLQLQAGSPCIDAGAPWILDVDGSRSDMGAFGGPGGSFYIYQDYPPSTPRDFAGTATRTSVTLSWFPNTEADVRYYAVFRSEGASIPLDSAHVIGYVPHRVDSIFNWTGMDTTRFWFTDSGMVVPQDYYYTVVAVDSSALVSPPATAVEFLVTDVQDIGTAQMPRRPELEQNYPNPFNAVTALVYALPNLGAQPTPIKLIVYNALGQQTKTLIDERQYPGRHTAYWMGDNDAGLPVASGVYFYRLEVSGIDFVESRKMVLLK